MARFPVVVFYAVVLCSTRRLVSSAAPGSCPVKAASYLHDLRFQCPVSISPNPPLQILSLTKDMDEEWEILPHDGFLDYCGDGEKSSFRRGKTIVFNTDYFVCPSSPPKNSKAAAKQLEPGNDPAEAEVTLVPRVIIPKVKDSGLEAADQDSVSQDSFKKMKGNEFVDMKLDSPTNSFTTTATTKGFLPQIDPTSFGFEEIVDHHGYKFENLEGKEGEENGGGVNLWKLSLTGLGAICWFGVAAAATVCIIILQKGNQHQNPKLGLQIYSDDKRINQVVHHATKLNEAISVARGVPITRAHVAFGGYYDVL